MIQDIKFKRQTTVTSQEVVGNVKSTSLDDADFDIDLVEEVLSNCSSRSGSRVKETRYERGMSAGSQDSRRSQESRKSMQGRGESRGIRDDISESKITDNKRQSSV